jgi:hypothetical protein
VRLHRATKKLKALLEERCAFEVDERNVLTCEPLHENMGGDKAPRSRPTYTIDAQSVPGTQGLSAGLRAHRR